MTILYYTVLYYLYSTLLTILNYTTYIYLYRVLSTCGMYWFNLLYVLYIIYKHNLINVLTG